MKLYLVRHAKPAVSEYKGFPGPSLGEEGKQQAQSIAQYLSDKGIEQVFMSDYTRVQETFAPFHAMLPNLQPSIHLALREREKEVESHESLVERVHEWYRQHEAVILSKPTAIFSHCGPINMLLEYLDPQKELLNYPYTCPYGCHTPLGAVWEMEIKQDLIRGGLLGACP